MDKTIKIYIGVLVFIFGLLIVIDMNKPEPIDWRPTYDTSDKIPLGLYVLDHEMPAMLKNQKIHKIEVTPYEYFEPKYDYDSLVDDYKVHGTFIDIAQDSYNLDEKSVEELFYFAGHGNDIFLSMKDFPKQLLDSLHLKLGGGFTFEEKNLQNWLVNPKLGTQKYNLVQDASGSYFSKIDTLKTIVLGYQSIDTVRVNFIKVPYRKGNFYLHTQPTAFTNFHLLDGNKAEYAEKVLSYLPKKDLYWYVKFQNGKVISNSSLSYIFSQPALTWAWYIFIFGMVIFMVFNAKRRQRIIPIVKPLTNTTIDFAKTIGNLYFQEGDHDNIIEKKIIYFLEKMRQDYLMDTNVLDEAFIKRLHLKSGKPIHDIQRVVYLINNYRKHNYKGVESDLIDMNDAIEKIIN
ncbi:DUF4350 domain-containing protein [Flavobacterium sp. 3HN19-14]|uniref:DUF4350 domain-containing protein n=1 Tax=Flavobacterium sp. 3HN19-14 TaxID=3448133 RepID=UPI003EE2A486